MRNVLKRLLTYLNYNNLSEIIEDAVNHKEIVIKLSSLIITKNARQGSKDEDLQLENINILKDYNITIKKNGKLKPIKSGVFSYQIKKQSN